jgi:hypothetical protein
LEGKLGDGYENDGCSDGWNAANNGLRGGWKDGGAKETWLSK